MRGFGMKSEKIIAEVLGWSDQVDRIRELSDYKEERYRNLVAQGGLMPLPGITSWLERLHEAGIPCAIASSTERANIDVVLEGCDLRRFFSAIVAGDEVRQGKPAPDIFLAAAARLGMVRGLVFEDALVGIEAAHRAGMAVVAVTTTHAADALSAADRVVDRLDRLTVTEAARLAKSRDQHSISR